jgi:hypothetical protein
VNALMARASTSFVPQAKTRMAPQTGLAELRIIECRKSVNPTCGDKPGHDVSLWLDAYPSTHCAQRHVSAPGHGGCIRKLRLEVGRRVAKGTHVIFFHRGEPASAARSLTMRTKATR